MSRLKLFVLVTIATAAALPPSAQAQERIELTQTPTLEHVRAALPGGVRWKRWNRSVSSAASAAWSLGAGIGSSANESGAVGAATVALGWRTSAGIVGFHSELTGFIPAEGEGLDLNMTRGRHRGIATLHIGKRSDDHGINLSFDAGARHSGGQPFRLDAPRFGAAPLQTIHGKIGTTLRFGGDEVSLGIPLTFRSEATRWDVGPLKAATGQTFSLGLGMVPNIRDSVFGSIDIIRAQAEHTNFESRAVLSSTGGISDDGRVADEFRKVTVAGGVTDLTFYDRHALGTFDAHIGYSWLESDQADRTLETRGVDFKLATNLQVGEPGDSTTFGFGFARDPNRSADGSRLISEWRLEISGKRDHGQTELGARGGLSWLSSKAGGNGEPTGTLIRYGTQLDAFYKLPLNFQAGGYLASSFEPQQTFDPFAVERSWATEAGLLIRWKRNPVKKQKPRRQQHRHDERENRPMEILAE